VNTTTYFAEPERCQRRRELFKYFNWLLTETWPNERAARSGYSTQSPDRRMWILDQLRNVTCTDPDTVEPLTLAGAVLLPQHQGGGYIAVFVIVMVAFATTAVIIVVFIVREWKIIPRPALAFAFLLLIGSSLAHISNIMWYLVPTTSAVCELRKWYVHVCFCHVHTRRDVCID
jgi:hypothetical protein